MIKANELRPGNIINKLFADSGQFQWSTFRKDEYDELEKFPDNFRPCKLTEGWLFKLGFEKEPRSERAKDFNWYKKHTKGDLSYTDIKIESNIYNGETIFRYNRPEIMGILFLTEIHRLQNLFWGLNCKELSIQ